MPLRSPSPARFLLLIFLQLSLTACSSSTPALPPAEYSPTARPAMPTLTSTAAPASIATSAAPTEALATATPDQAACQTAQQVEVDPAAILELGPGPGIPATTAAGEKLVIVGSVYAKDCTPLKGVRMNFWQTDANGEYGPGHGSADMRCCYLMGSLRTDAHGRYQLITVKPAHYKGEQPPPPAHIHIEISHPQAGQFGAEIVFTGDPYLPRSLQGYVLVTLETVPGSGEAPAYLRGVADIILD